MSLSTLGKRYERLLLLAAPISLASIVTLFVVFATNAQEERARARCYESASAFLETKSQALEAEWKKLSDTKSGRPERGIAEIKYAYAVRRLLIDVQLGSTCYKSLLDESDNRYRDEPKVIISKLRDESKQLLAAPIKYAGVDVPAKANISLMGTNVTVELTLFANLLQIVLAPLMFLWLGSLYNTRYRETLLIASAKVVSDVFPHTLNIYPVIRYPEPRRRSLLKPYLPHLVGFLYSCTRVFLLLLIVGPSVGAYVASVLILESHTYYDEFLALAAMVVVSSLAVVIVEFFPWHWRKTFSGLESLSKAER